MLGHHLSTSEKSVSARHVYLTETELGWEIKNDGAADGLMVNGKMQARALLQDGDEILIGDIQLKFQGVGEHPLNYSVMHNNKTGAWKVLGAIMVFSLAAIIFYLANHS